MEERGKLAKEESWCQVNKASSAAPCIHVLAATYYSGGKAARDRDPTWGCRDAGALLGAQRRHSPAAGRTHGCRLHVQLPVEVAVVA